MLESVLPKNSPVRQRMGRLARRAHFVPARLRNNYSKATREGVEELRNLLRSVYFPSWYSGTDMEAFFGSPEAAKAFDNHISGRLENDRCDLVPWIDNALGLRGSKILEVGCGTGSATLALAEQGAEVVGLDVHTEALAVARLRAEVHGVGNVSFIQGNAESLGRLLGPFKPDLILFFAVLEHMTLAERRDALREAWSVLPVGKFLGIAETPNRLWFYDGHTSQLPFYHWLPDELAIEFSRFSPRYPFNSRFNGGGTEFIIPFLREGRGFSFHDLELALKEPAKFRVVSDQTSFLSRRNPAIALKRLVTGDGRRERMLNAYAPTRHRGFFREYVNILIEKVA